jgi:HAD superfamily hydrolase (TIGR01509 family)
MIDSEPNHLKTFNIVLERYGVLPTEKENDIYVGKSNRDICLDLVSRYDLPVSSEELGLAKVREYQNLLKEGVVAQKGVRKLVRALHHAGYPLAVASGSQLSDIEIVISKLGLSDFFDVLVSAEQVSNGKPAPDIFLLAAKKLDIGPEECLVLEHAWSGLLAAKRAGMKCIIVPSRETVGQDFSEADHVLQDLDGVRRYVEKGFS